MFKAIQNIGERKGFTLIEILFVIIVIAILAAIAIMRITTTRQNAEDNACAALEAIINTQIEQAMLDGFVYTAGGSYPADQNEFDTELLTSLIYFPDGVPACQGPTPACTYNAATDRAACVTGN